MLLDILLRNSLLESNGIPTQCSLRKKKRDYNEDKGVFQRTHGQKCNWVSRRS